MKEDTGMAFHCYEHYCCTHQYTSLSATYNPEEGRTDLEGEGAKLTPSGTATWMNLLAAGSGGCPELLLPSQPVMTINISKGLSKQPV